MRNLRSDHHGVMGKYHVSFMKRKEHYVLPKGVWQGVEWKASATSLFFLSSSHLQPSATEINPAWALSIWINKSFFFFFSPASVIFPNCYFNYYVSFYWFLSLLCRVHILPILQFMMLCPKSLSSLLMIWFSMCFRCFACGFHLTLQADLHGD